MHNSVLKTTKEKNLFKKHNREEKEVTFLREIVPFDGKEEKNFFNW